MTNLVFIEHRKVPKDQARAIKEDLQAYAISIAMRLPFNNIPEEEKVRVAKFSLRNLLKQFDLSTKNLGSIIHDEVVNNLQRLYIQLKKKTNYEFFLEMVQMLRFLKRRHPAKYRRIVKSIEVRLSARQKTILSLYLNYKSRSHKYPLTYKKVGKIIKSTKGPISGEVKQMVKSIDKIFRMQKIKHGR